MEVTEIVFTDLNLFLSWCQVINVGSPNPLKPIFFNLNGYKLPGALLGLYSVLSTPVLHILTKLTGDEYDDQPEDVLPEQLVLGYFAADLLVVDNVGGHVAGEAVRDVDGKCEHHFGTLSQSENNI